MTWTIQKTSDSELYHHGILGQKWGIRRYQNKDGTLTDEGIARRDKQYSQMSDKKLHKVLTKQIREARKNLPGKDWSNQWEASTEIGPKSQAIRDQYRKENKQWEESEPVKKWNFELRKLDRQFEKGSISPDEYDEKFEALIKQRPERNFRDLQWAYVYGKGYVNDYVNKGGRDLSVARLEDLGYDRKSAEKYVNRLAKSGLTLGGQ